ncbi:TonB-dependent receptor domain-containing protein [Glacieibacterium sp.]|uniref:TonB-dependent receptor domain-containing protein n=1 Tax=Glacieibacterium sp. TaxID=2860237 RepID=UPI003B0097B3
MVVLPAAVYAQPAVQAPPTGEAPPPAAAASDTAASADGGIGNEETIVVTGSRIRRPNLQSTVPVTSVSGQEFFETGSVAIGDTLNQLPALRSTFSQANSTRFLGTTGLNLLDLRGLGTARTLVLVNGRRHVGSDILNNAVSPDTNTIPTDLIERVDVVTGGNSAVYGSDAVAGVVNFVLKNNFDGLQVRGQSGISTYGDAGARYASVLAGKNFADGRGNIAVNLEYARQDRFSASDRPNLRTTSAFVVVDTDPASAVNGADGTPDRQFFRDIRSATIAPGGQLGFASPTGACGRDSNGAAYTCGFLFQPDGTLVPQTGTRVGLAPNGNFVGGNGSNNREGQILGILPQQDRYSFNALGHFDVSPAFVPFFEAKYVRINTVGSQSGPAFFQGANFGDDPANNRERPRLDNPFLTAQARTLITQQLLAANPAADVSDSGRFTLRENLLDLGIRQEASRRETYRAVVGVRGDFNDDWNYELSANYGVFKERTKVEGNLNVQRFLLGLDSTRNAAGQIVCRSQIDPSAAIDYVGGQPAILARDVAACVPVNPFGSGNISQAARNYSLSDTTSVGKITQLDISGFVNGDTSQLFSLPGGPIAFSLGGEYRRETNYFVADPLVAQGYTFYNSLPLFDPPSFQVKELFGEIRVPLVKDVPFLQELTLSGSGRVSDYKGAVGTVYAYNGGVDWTPVNGLRLRGAYSRSVRAPNLSELYAAQSQNFTPAPDDPCSARNIGTGSATRAANCAAAGIPTSYDYVYTSSLEIRSGGNPNLQAEKSDSYTVGGVFTPAFAPGLSLTADYFDITVNKVISSVDAQDILNNCYDSPTLTNPFCGSFTRQGATGTGPVGEQPFRVIEGSLLTSVLNFAKLKTRGIDVELAYTRQVEGVGQINARVAYTHVFQNDQFLDPSQPNYADRLLLELGNPRDAANFNLGVKRGAVGISYQGRYIGKQVLNTYEDLFSVQGRAPENADYASSRFYKAVVYHDVRIAFDASDKFNIYGGVDNALNKKVQFGGSGVGDGTGIYEPKGRYMYVGVVAKY